MSLILALLLGAPPPAPDPAAERARFPSCEVVSQQSRRCARHKEWLKYMGGVRGWEGGRWKAWAGECERHQAYWAILDEWGGADRRGEQLRELIGTPAYVDGWHPPLIPEDAPWLRTPPAPAMPTAAGANNAAP